MKKLILTTLIFLSLTGIVEGENPQKNLWKITFYCGEKCCCGKWSDGLTASGFPLTTEVNIAANNFLPFGTIVEIEGYGEYIILDRGSVKHFGLPEDKVKRIDIFVVEHKLALTLGQQFREVKVK